MTGYGSHIPILAALIARTSGPILELGCGDSSTPLIHYSAAGRYVLSVDTDAEWLKKFSGYESESHRFAIVTPKGDDALPKVTREIQGWREWGGIESRKWGLAFVDCAPGEARHEIAIRLAKIADFVLCHDSETDYASGGNYMYDKCIPYFAYRSEFRRFRPYSLILSNKAPFEIESCDREWIPEGLKA